MSHSGKEEEQFHECVKVLASCEDREVFLNTGHTLIKIARNILDEPRNEKHKNIKITSQLFCERLLPVNGAVQCLFAMGFVENDEYLTFPTLAPRDDLVKISQQIKLKMAGSIEKDRMTTPTRPSGSSSTKSEMQLLAKLKGNMRHVRMYENKRLQKKAFDLVPMDEFTKKPEYPTEENVGEIDNSENPDVILLKLLAWFKSDFFTWTNNPKCGTCGKPDTFAASNTSPTHDESRWLAHNVELYKCASCSSITRFPRFNHPEKLMETRTGRCGEWANCFTFMCRALGYDARYVLDFTDHVWTEVYSEKQKRWLHCDPCENICDKPLVYERGWKKKLTYVFAFAVDNVMDVTWRYSADHKEILRRRNLCREVWLWKSLAQLNKQLQNTYSKEVADKLQIRYVRELVEFLAPVKENVTEYGGRISGSLEWRLLRGETEHKKQQNEQFIFRLTETEIANKKFHIRYYCSRDQYMRLSNKNEVMSGFTSCLIWHKGMFRKVEQDWGMVYIARKPSEPRGTLCWSFNFQDSKLCFRSISIRMPGTVFHNGKVEAKMLIDTRIIPISTDGENTLVESIEFENKFMLCVEVSGGEGDVAWQHAQLFRQELSSNAYSFEMMIDFMKDSDVDTTGDLSISE